MPIETPAMDSPGNYSDDFVTNEQMAQLFIGQPLDVYNYLQVPGNVGDDTQVIYSIQAPPPYSNTICYAYQYIEMFSTVYPDIVIPPSS